VTIDSGQANLAFCCAFVDELAANGLTHAVICPGSRSTPLAVALAAHREIRTWVQVDERSAAFFALGMARQLRQPVAILCTSGTAAANFSPPVAEASLSRIPLLVLTADRPPELRDWGAAQTINQIELYGSHVKWFVDMPVPDDEPALLRQARASAARALAAAATAPAGPIHLNFPFREPLLPLDLRAPLDLEASFGRGRRGHALVATPSTVPNVDDVTIEAIATLLAGTERGIIVAGPSESHSLAGALRGLSAATGFPVLADPLSGLRFGARERDGVIDGYDSFLRDERTAERLAPEVVIRVGAVPTSKPLQQFLAAHPGDEHLVVDDGAPRDPLHLATRYLIADPAEAISRVSAAVTEIGVPTTCEWRERWRAVDALTRRTIADYLAGMDELFEGRACSEVASLLPDGATLVVGNSMPVRDVDAFVRGDERRLRVVGTRGANGIDGVVSSALGGAAVSSEPLALIVGDLSFYHDMNGLLAAGRFGLSATVVVLNNDGGGIFSFLPQAQQLEREQFEALFGTPIGLDVAGVAELYECAFERPRTWDAFQRAVSKSIAQPGVSIIEVVTDRQHNVELHRRISTAVTEALHGASPGDLRRA
jgi:2-succinyl-5-enolpyruvyl-6-hydroxy-3-cyclohexene-1-carboxylate synthase